MTAATNHDERLASIETSIQHLLSMFQDLRTDIKTQQATYVSEATCQLQHDSARREIETTIHAVRDEARSLCNALATEINNAKDQVSVVDKALAEMRRSWANRLWAIALPVIGAIILGIMSLLQQPAVAVQSSPISIRR